MGSWAVVSNLCTFQWIAGCILILQSTMTSTSSQTNQCNMTGDPDVDDTYTWRSTSDFIPLQGESCGDMYIGHVTSLHFDFVWHGRTTVDETEMFFRVGFDSWYGTSCDGQAAQYPSLWIEEDSDYLMLGVSDSDSCENKYTMDDYGNITTDVSHYIEIYFDDDILFVNITGGGKDDYIRSWNKTHLQYDHLGQVVPVWFMSTKFGGTEYNRGNGTFSNIVITSSQFTTYAPTLVPTPNPTMSPSSEPTTTAPSTASPSTAGSTEPPSTDSAKAVLGSTTSSTAAVVFNVCLVLLR